ncbi:MAG TPA: BMP family ABC transporter substrate-binding protein, partial [Mycobacteriales bacterium]|nr:BMP family ABC transporter substrate-binding protein [Mycobacteriales bacterium]
MRGMGLAAAALVGALTLAACGSSDSGSSSGDSGSGGSAAPSNLKIGMAYDIGGRGDKSFNDSAAVGLDTAKKDFNLSDDNVKELSARAGETDTDRATRLELLAKSGFNPVLAIGFAYAPALKTVAPKYPDVKFGIIDATPDDVSAPNVTNLTFAEEQGSFLVGAAAALKSKTGTVGFVGGCLVPLIKKFEAGYIAGAKAANPAAKVLINYLS